MSGDFTSQNPGTNAGSSHSASSASAAVSSRITRMIAGVVDRGERDRGASMVEYGLLLVLVLLVAFFSIKVFGDTIVALFDLGSTTLEEAPNVNGNSGAAE